MTQTVTLRGKADIALANRIMTAAPVGSRVEITPPGRSVDQNSRLWSMLSDVSRQIEHAGRKHTPETWKCLFMHALWGVESTFIEGLDGEIFPMGFRSSKLSKKQMTELQEFIEAWGVQHGVRFRVLEEVA